MTRYLALFAALLLAVEAARADTFHIMAFGDSITDGYPYCDVGCPLPDATAPYPARLSSRLSCTLPGCQIHNRGCGGEKTGTNDPFCGLGGGVTRIDLELANLAPGERWDQVLLMEGTNDIPDFGTSAATIASNLGVIDGKATAAGADTVHASIPWYNDVIVHPDPPNPPPGLNPKVQQLRNEIANLANSLGRYFVDIWNVLCPTGNDVHGHPQNTCFTTHWFDELHPDKDGLWMIGDQFYNVISSVAVPGAATPVAPSGDLCGDPASFDFTKESPDRANWYEISIDDAGNLYDEWHQESDLCTGADCSLATPPALGEGSYTWRVRTRNPLGHGPWSAALAFEVVTTPTGPVTTLSAPVGGSTDTSPSFVWDEVSGATSYRLMVEDSAAATVLDATYDAATICAASTCTAVPGLELAVDAYDWKVQALNPCAADWSAAQSFSVQPLAPMPLGPGGELVTSTPTYRWRPSSGATDYDLEVTENGTPQGLTPAPPYSASSVCGAAECLVTLSAPALSVGPAYAWRVRASHTEAGAGPWSAQTQMTRVSCDPTDPLIQQNQTVTGSPPPVRGCSRIHTGNLGDGDFTVAASAVLIHHAGTEVVWFDGLRVDLDGNYTVRVDG